MIADGSGAENVEGGLLKNEIDAGGDPSSQPEVDDAGVAPDAMAQHSIFSPAVHPMTMYNYGGVAAAAAPGQTTAESAAAAAAAAGQAALFPYATTAAYATDYNGQAIVNPYALSAGGIPFTYVIAANPADPAAAAAAAATGATPTAGGATAAATASTQQQPVAMAPSSYPSFIVPFGAQTPLMAATGPNGTVTYYAPQPAGIQTDPATGAIQVLSAGAHPWATATAAATAAAASSDPNNAVTGFSDVTSSQQLVTGSSPVAASSLQPAGQQQQGIYGRVALTFGDHCWLFDLFECPLIQ